MHREISYEDCIGFIERELNIKLYNFQKEIIKAFCEGKEVRTCRCAGRTLCAEAFGKYIAHVYDRNDYFATPEVTIPYQRLVEENVLSNEIINKNRSWMTEERFQTEYCCQ